MGSLVGVAFFEITRLKLTKPEDFRFGGANESLPKSAVLPSR